MCRWSQVQNASQVILFGDGNSDFDLLWPNDHWWIWKEAGDANSMGFNRATENDPGAFRHNRKSNYAFGDGSAALLNPGAIPCNKSACWWSVVADPHK
jgi:prepilin-type processing-associated H-X9-DG protein